MINGLESALADAASPKAAQSLQRFFPHPVTALGVSNADVATIAGAAFKRNPDVSVDEWMMVADHFARSHRYHEHLILASALAAKLVRAPDDGRLFDLMASWLESDVSNWAQCDDLCIKPLYLYLKRRPQLLGRIGDWGASASPWLRRASNVALVKFVGRSEHVHLEKVFANCARLLTDGDPYVQKGIGWILKVASRHAPHDVLAFIEQHDAVIQRSTRRYALEKLRT
ncbi:MAG: DNA alkylation repair protein [Telluria sp.]|nr:DNA alkylation repair protein [Telluria sp.]